MDETTTAVKVRPIIMSAESVAAILAGTKTQTRRAVKPQPPARFSTGDHALLVNQVGTRWAWSRIHTPGGRGEAWPPDPEPGIACPYGRPGDRLWVREAWWLHLDAHQVQVTRYCASEKSWPGWPKVPRSPMFMPRWASRLTLELTTIRIERVQSISEADARAEGWTEQAGQHPYGWYRDLWDTINGKTFAWSLNPFVWVLTFAVVPQPEPTHA